MADTGMQLCGADRAARNRPRNPMRDGERRRYENILVLSGDVPLIRTETIQELWSFHVEQDAAMTSLTAMPENPAGYGRVVRRDAQSAEVEAIVEQKMLTPEQAADSGDQCRGLCLQDVRPLKAHLEKLEGKQSRRPNFT